MAPTMLEESCKRIQHCCATFRRLRNKRNVGSCWPKSLPGFKLCATTSNNIQQGVQTDARCNIQHWWELLANNVASVCTGFKSYITLTLHFSQHDRAAILRVALSWPPRKPTVFARLARWQQVTMKSKPVCKIPLIMVKDFAL